MERKTDMERVQALIDTNALRDNVRAIHGALPDATRLMAVIKADAYGHGAVDVAGICEGMPEVYGYAVATAAEALTLRKAKIKKPLMVLGVTAEETFDALLIADVELTVFREDTLVALSTHTDALCRLGVLNEDYAAKVHIAVDCGMTRIGISPDEAGAAFVRKALETPHIRVTGIFTHFSRADEADLSVTEAEANRFLKFREALQGVFPGEAPLFHASNSASILQYTDAHLDMVRAGIILYGLRPSLDTRMTFSVRPVMRFLSRVVYVREVKEGTPVSYGGTFVTNRMTRIATVSCGYADGYPRALSGKGEVLIKGQRAKIIGRICMDQFMADVTEIPDVKEGDEVTLIGRDGNEELTMEEVGAQSGRFHYEFACCIGQRVPRIYS